MSVKKGTRQKGSEATSRKSTSRPKPKTTSAATLPLINLSLTIADCEAALLTKDIEKWKRQADRYGRILERRDCPEAFRRAFRAVFVDGFINEEFGLSVLSSPSLLPVLYPFVFLYAMDAIPATADGYEASLTQLCNEFVPNEMRDEIEAAMKAEKDGAK